MDNIFHMSSGSDNLKEIGLNLKSVSSFGNVISSGHIVY